MEKLNEKDGSTCKLELLNSLGLSREYYDIANSKLIDAGLTAGKKVNIHNTKIETAKRVIDEHFMIICTNCQNEMSISDDLRNIKNKVIVINNQHCHSCSGSRCKHLSGRTIIQLKKNKVESLAIIGGFPKQINNIKNELKPYTKLSLIDGTKKLSKKFSTPIVKNSDLIVIWCRTPIGHSSTNIFKNLKNVIYVNSASTVGFWSSLLAQTQRITEISGVAHHH